MRAVLNTLNATEAMPRALVQAALHSTARLAMIPMQDIVKPGAGRRMNTPGSTNGNWEWRFTWKQMSGEVVDWWGQAVAASGRATTSVD